METPLYHSENSRKFIGHIWACSLMLGSNDRKQNLLFDLIYGFLQSSQDCKHKILLHYNSHVTSLGRALNVLYNYYQTYSLCAAILNGTVKSWEKKIKYTLVSSCINWMKEKFQFLVRVEERRVWEDTRRSPAVLLEKVRLVLCSVLTKDAEGQPCSLTFTRMSNT